MFYSYDLLNPRDGALSLIWQLGNLEDASKWRDVAKKSDVWNARIVDFCNEIAKRLPIQNRSRLDGLGSVDGGEGLRDHFSLRLTSILFSGLVQCHCLRMELILREVRAFQLRQIKRPKLTVAIDLPKGKKGAKEAEVTHLDWKDDASYFGHLDPMEEGPTEIETLVFVPRFKAHEESITMREFEIPRDQMEEDDNFGMGTGVAMDLEFNPFLEEDVMVTRPPRLGTLISPSLLLGDDFEENEMAPPCIRASPPPLPPNESPPQPEMLQEAPIENEHTPPIVITEAEEKPESESTASPSMSPLGEITKSRNEPPKKKRRRKLAIDEKIEFDKETLLNNFKTFSQLQFTETRFQRPSPRENLLEVMGRPMIQSQWTDKFLFCAKTPFVESEDNLPLGPDQDAESLKSTDNQTNGAFYDESQVREVIPNSPKPRSESGLGDQGNFEISIGRDGTRNASSLIEQSRLSELKNSNLMNSLPNDQPEPTIGDNLPENDDFAFPSPPHLNTIVERTESVVADTSEVNFPQQPPLPEPLSPQSSSGSSKTLFNPLELPSEHELLEKVEEQQLNQGKAVTFDTLVGNFKSKRAVAKCFSQILVLASKRLLVARQEQCFGSILVHRV
ncbi:uncharacterized protein LOC131888366 [Tigriopus californicus]|uniref:uncharacterized protein LOC131888366 n=1 Tax=Tigriopus californicus TaxID=6832 RepID=UPI0027DAA41A|nr:uncharacterized protein LOC131888366 [Tigriopus californicus]